MSGFIGEYYCKLDVKGRMLIPSDVRKQLSPIDQEQFVISRGVDYCLSMYTSSEWSVVMSKLRKLNRFKSKDRKFARMFQKGATKITVDSNGRLLLPRVKNENNSCCHRQNCRSGQINRRNVAGAPH